MKLQANSAEKPIRKLRKQLKSFPPHPTPEAVHTLRTQTRRLEATVAALALDQESKSRDLLNLIRPVRKAAGKVRDMDVLIGNVLRISGEPGNESAVRLVEHLAKMRVKNSRKLRNLIRRQHRETPQRLKEFSKIIRRTLKNAVARIDGTAGTQILITELSHWPDLNQDNLHLFRIRIKELRYMLQLSEIIDEKLVNALGEVKDAVGEWHDWIELLKIARKALNPQTDKDTLEQIENAGHEKLVSGLAVANALRTRYFNVPDGLKTSRKLLSVAS